MESVARSRARSLLFLLLLSFCTLWLRLGALPFVGADESRYARIAEEMWHSGRWVTPTLEGRPWLEKPPLYYWITVPLYSLAGTGEATARLGVTLATLLSALALWGLGSLLHSRLAGLLSAAILLSTVGYVAFGRSASTDMPMTACLTAAMSVLCAAVTRPVSSLWLGCAYVLLGMAILAKGPVALLLAAGAMLLFWVLDERGGAWRRWKAAFGVVLLSLTTFPWFWLAYRENGWSFVLVFFVNHNLARYVSDIHHHAGPLYYYLGVLPALMFPWTFWLAWLIPRRFAACLRNWRHWDPGTLFLLCWALFPLLFFSLSSSKLPGYILPSMPPLALLLGRRLAQMRDSTAEAPPAYLGRLGLAVSLLVAAALPVVFGRVYGRPQTGLLLGAFVLVPGLVCFRATRSGRWLDAAAASILQGAALTLAVALFAFPAIGLHHSARDAARGALQVRAAGEPIVSYGYFHHTLHYYTGYQVAEDISDLTAFDAFARRHPRFLVVTPLTRLSELMLEGRTVSVLATHGRLCVARSSGS